MHRKRRQRTADATPRKTSKYRSTFEATIASQLQIAQVKFAYEKTRLAFTKQHSYLPDFHVNQIFIEVKGYFKASDRAKHLLIKEQNPGLDVRFVFQRAGNRLNKGSSTTYAQWCDKHGFKWAEGKIPAAWLVEQGTAL